MARSPGETTRPELDEERQLPFSPLTTANFPRRIACASRTSHSQALALDPAWQYHAIEPKLKAILQGNAPDIGAVDWRYEIRKDPAERK